MEAGRSVWKGTLVNVWDLEVRINGRSLIFRGTMRWEINIHGFTRLRIIHLVYEWAGEDHKCPRMTPNATIVTRAFTSMDLRTGFQYSSPRRSSWRRKTEHLVEQ